MAKVMSEMLSREQLLSQQWLQLKDLLRRIYDQDSLYARKLKSAGIALEHIQSLADFQRLVPTSDKAELLADQTESPPYGRRLIGKDNVAFSFLTSGTSGKGQEVHAYSFQDYENLLDSWAKHLNWTGIKPGDTAYLMMPVGTTVGPISLMMAFYAYGLQTFNVGHLDGVERLQMMRRFKPNFFTTSPLYLRRFSNICREMGIDPRKEFPDLKAIKLGTFTYDMPWAKEMEAFWGCKLSDIYASTQAGAGIATTCEQGVCRTDGTPSIMHFLEDKAVFEVVDPVTGLNAKDGEEGEVIVTTFRTAMPLLRFRTGDRVRFRGSSSCGCGRPFAGIEVGSVSRYDSMIKIRGMNLWPESVDSVVFKHPEIEEYNGRVTVDSLGRESVELLLAFRAALTADEGQLKRIASEIEFEVKALTNVGMKAVAVDPVVLEKFVYKGSRWKDMRSASGNSQNKETRI